MIRTGISSVIATLAAATFAGAMSEAAGGRPTQRTCQARGSETLLATRYARVLLSAHGVYYGCRYGGRPIRLGTGGVDHGFGSFRLVRERLAYAYVYCSRYQDGLGCETRIHMLNLRSRAKRSRHFVGTGGVGGVEMGRKGSVAFLLRGNHDRLADTVTRVYVLGRDGLTLLDSGDDIAGNSLALGGSTLYWRKGDQVRTAVLR